jgi:hypothetical protein
MKVVYEKCIKCGRLELFEGINKICIEKGRDLTMSEIAYEIHKMEIKK